MSDKKPLLNKTENTFNNDRIINRAYEIRRDQDLIKTPTVDLEDINFSLLYYMQKVIKPTYIVNGEEKPVLIEYALPEKWKTIQSIGSNRTIDGKLVLPYISFRRTTSTKTQELSHNKTSRDLGNEYTFKKPYSKVNRYDSFSILNNRIPVEEYYSIAVPDYITINYELVVLTNLIEDLDAIAEKFHFHQGRAWGDTNKFLVFMDEFSYENNNNFNEDRTHKGSANLTVHAYLIPSNDGESNNMKRQLSKAQLRITSELSQIEEVKEPITTFSHKSLATPNIDLYDGGIVA